MLKITLIKTTISIAIILMKMFNNKIEFWKEFCKLSKIWPVKDKNGTIIYN